MSGTGSDDPFYQAALAGEEEFQLTAEMAEWEIATIADWLGEGSRQRNPGAGG
jgi:hypothetical protein